MTLKYCSKDDLVVSSISWLPIDFQKGSTASKGYRMSKSSIKAWNKFAQSLRHKKVKTMKDFKVESQWRRQCDENVDKMCMKRDENEHDEHVYDESNLRRKVCECNCKK